MRKFFSISLPILGFAYGIIGILYEASKIRMIGSLGGTLVGYDVLLMVYATSILSCIATVIGLALNQNHKTIKFTAWLGLTLSLLVLVTWAVLNMNGFIISHEAMMQGK